MRRLMEKSLQIRMQQVDQVFGQLRRNLLFGAGHQMETDVILQHFAHQSIDSAPNRRQQHELSAAIFIEPKGFLYRIQLAAQFANTLQQLHSLPVMVRHLLPPMLTIPTPSAV